MPWYKAGTVSVTQNSNAVIGTGTAFIANSRVGDAFRGPDGGWYEVTNIASDTALSISPNYQGATNAAGVYALAPMQGYVKDSADALRALVNTYGTKLAALGTTGNYDVLPASKGGTGISDLSVFIQTLLNDQDAAAGRGTLVAARSGPNSDITSLAGLTTALSVTQGGTGVATIAALLAALQAAGAYGKSNVVGTVSQSGGVPTGAIVESGSNTNGTYTKFADGTMICKHDLYVTGAWAINAAIGPLFYNSTPLGLSYPINFSTPPIVQMTLSTSGGAQWLFVGSAATTSSTPSYHTISAVSTTAAVRLSYIAIGRWY
ncbi:phage tail protein [Pseudomonas sp. MDT2-39-1]